ncbi:hypothetical protein ACVMB3_002636 [Sinorhizobium meliloti]
MTRPVVGLTSPLISRANVVYSGAIETDDADPPLIEGQAQRMKRDPFAEADRAIGKADFQAVGPRDVLRDRSIGQVDRKGQCSADYTSIAV